MLMALVARVDTAPRPPMVVGRLGKAPFILTISLCVDRVTVY
jgi:hypothetical protein